MTSLPLLPPLVAAVSTMRASLTRTLRWGEAVDARRSERPAGEMAVGEQPAARRKRRKHVGAATKTRMQAAVLQLHPRPLVHLRHGIVSDARSRTK
jgi:hypothetical protein